MRLSLGTAEVRRQRLRSAAQASIAALVLAALILAVIVWQAAGGGATVTADAGEKVPLQYAAYGREMKVVLPGSEITFVVGEPVDRIGNGLLDVEYDDPRWDDQQDLGAPDDGSLLPISWRTQALGGFGREDDPNPIDIRLVAGDERVDLDSVVLGGISDSLDAYEPRSMAVGVDGGSDGGGDAADLAIEVEYDGLTQTVHLASGEIDAGVAQAYYDDDRAFTAGCTEVDDQCPLRAVDPDSPVQPDSDSFTASYLSLYPYDAQLGWADEGTLWASVRLHLFGTNGMVNAAGDYWSVELQTAPVVTLDGAEPVRREGLEASDFDTYGRVVFRVDTDAEPHELTLEQVISMNGPDAPADLPVRAQVALTRVD